MIKFYFNAFLIDILLSLNLVQTPIQRKLHPQKSIKEFQKTVKFNDIPILIFLIGYSKYQIGIFNASPSSICNLNFANCQYYSALMKINKDFSGHCIIIPFCLKINFLGYSTFSISHDEFLIAFQIDSMC